ncbi:hypothetical protein EYC84_005922 [Monilinia fructicola]|uniref:Uncharacterized protein n=1 Tax=Monilinia fructicola TaxID=38448 RepID=A0A5M9JZ12_MONFR|nr:hypothetical protein EYC84_005922 [Monilinia fructicola]
MKEPFLLYFLLYFAKLCTFEKEKKEKKEKHKTTPIPLLFIIHYQTNSKKLNNENLPLSQPFFNHSSKPKK